MKKGILLPIFSLPSKYGIGDFGNEAYKFIDILKNNNIEYWQILPINDGGQYPYSPISYYALNKNYISIDKLLDMKLLKKVKYKEFQGRIQYDNFKESMYKEAFYNFKPDEEYETFCLNKNMQEYAKYMYKKYGQDFSYTLFLQYILVKQWKELKKYANDNGIKIIGDLPIYPNFDSVEIEYHSKYYDLVNGKMKFVSGASPDYFNSEGQKWGHPLYNFKVLKMENYRYLIERYKEFLSMYDIVRIDHFRAFDTYYMIPVDKPAIDGHYEKGPGSLFFDELFKYTSSDRFIVEDLGDITEDVVALRDKYNFTKMKILQYTINLESIEDEYCDTENMVVYTGNHDNNTIVGWYNNLNDVQKENLRKFLKKNNCECGKINMSMIKYALKSNAKYVIIPAQDIIGLGESARINLPGHEYDDNWSWQLENFNDLVKNMDVFKL